MRIVVVGVGAMAAASAALYFFSRQVATEKPKPAAPVGNISDGAKLVEVPDIDLSFMDKVVNNVTKVLEPRGIRNNNPGNLVITSIPWLGKVPRANNTDGVFEQFYDAKSGIRAMFMDIRGDIEKDGLNTIRKLITEYAPPKSNNTAAYIQSVVNRVGIGADTKIQKANYLNLMKAIIHHENGKQPYSDDQIIAAMGAA